MPGEAVDLENGGGVKHRANRESYSSSSYVADDAETKWTSWLVPMFVVINIFVFLVAMYMNDCPNHSSGMSGIQGKCVARVLGKFSFQPLKENPLLGPSSSTLEKLGALEWFKAVHKHQGWRLVTCIWLHAGVVHLVVDMLSLVFIGIRIEQQFGFVRVGIIYMLSGFGGSIMSSLFIQKNISVGVSGALFGLLGSMLLELITNWTIYTNKVAALVTLLVITVINLGIGILPRVDNFAHIGGFITGFLIGFVFMPRPQFGWLEQLNLPAGANANVKSKFKAYQYVLWLLSVTLLIVGFTVALVMLFRGENGNEHCHWCHYLSCIPTSRWHCEEN
ncbi:hypothetical protein ACLB2K_075146 [Fragaria x ananassa]